MKNAYYEMKERHQKEFNALPVIFAFSKKQFKEGMEKLGLTEQDADKIYHLGSGGYYRKTDAPMFKEFFERKEKEHQEAIANDKTGDGYIYDMFYYELNNHEYGYTEEIDDTLYVLGYTYSDIQANDRLKHALKKACDAIRAEHVEFII